MPHKSFQSGEEVIEAVRGVSFEVPRGACTFIVGPSGSGKSTSLYMLGGLDNPSSGTIIIDDQNLTAMTEVQQDAFRRQKIGFIFQQFNLIHNLTAVGNVLLPFIPIGLTAECQAKAKDILRQVGLGHRLLHKPSKLSRRPATASRDRPGPDQGPRRYSSRMNPPETSTTRGATRSSLCSASNNSSADVPWWSSPTTDDSSSRATMFWRSRTGSSRYERCSTLSSVSTHWQHRQSLVVHQGFQERGTDSAMDSGICFSRSAICGNRSGRCWSESGT